MKKNQILLVILLILITNLIVVSENSRNCIKPKDGFVPDKETTIKIAEAVWYPIYGERINNKKTFNAELVNNEYWKVYGTLPEGWKVEFLIQK